MDVHIPCICPPDKSRHPDGDTVTLADRLDWDEAMACYKAMDTIDGGGADASLAEAQDVTARRLAAVTKQYLFSGIKSWSLMNGAAIPVTADTISTYLLADFGVSVLVSDEAEELYNNQVLVPLLRRAAKSSQPTPMDDSISASKDSTASRRRRSSPSSTSTTRTVDTGTIT